MLRLPLRFQTAQGRQMPGIAVYAAFLLIMYTLASYFVPYVNPIGDVQAYVNSDGFDVWSYQPLWPYVAGFVNLHHGIDGLYVFQRFIYAFSALLILLTLYGRSRVIACTVVGFIAINVAGYFYLANPLTENFNLFAFCVALFLWNRSSQLPHFGLWMFTTWAFICLGLTRSSNLLFIAALAGLCLLHIARDRRWVLAALIIIMPALLGIGLWTIQLQSHGNANTGMNLMRVIVLACEENPATSTTPCPADVFSAPESPTIHAYYESTGHIARVPTAFAARGLSEFTDQYNKEVKATFRRLLLLAPGKLLHAGWVNYTRHVDAEYLGIYPDDPNIAMTNQPTWQALAIVSNWIARIVALLCPALVLIAAITRPFVKRIDPVVVFCTAWAASEIFASFFLFSNDYVSDASRMRYHYLIPGLILLLEAIRYLVRTLMGAFSRKTITVHG